MADNILFNIPEEVRPEHIEKYVVPVRSDGSLHLDHIRFRAFQGAETEQILYYVSTLGVGGTSPATGSSYSTDITITGNITVGTELFIVALFGSIDGAVPAFLNNGAVTDTAGGTWHSVPNNGNIIGAINEETASNTLEIMGWSYRDIASETDLIPGDTVTIPWHTTTSGTVPSQNKYSMFMVLEYANLDWSTLVTQGGSTILSNGDDYPDGSSDPTTLSWPIDVTFPQNPAPDTDAYNITLAAAYPAQANYTPAETDSRVVTRADDVATLIVTEQIDVPASQAVDPGGTWDDAATLLAGNYQFMTKTA